MAGIYPLVARYPPFYGGYKQVRRDNDKDSDNHICISIKQLF